MSGAGTPRASTGDARARGADQQHDVCPAEHAGWLTVPVRRLFQDPRRILRGLIRPGDTAVELGCGPGYFTLPMAAAGGPAGPRDRRGSAAGDAGQDERARRGRRPRRAHHRASVLRRTRWPWTTPAPTSPWRSTWCTSCPTRTRFLAEAHAALKPGARLLVVEPRPEVHGQAFARLLVVLMRAAGFTEERRSQRLFSRGVLLRRS